MYSVFIGKQVDKFLALGLLLTCLTTVYLFAKYVYLDQLEILGSEIELKKKKNAKIDSILVDEKTLRTRIRQQQNLIRKNNIFLNSSDSTAAASELQNYIKKLIATNSKAKIQTIKPFPVFEHGNYSEASLEIRIRDIGHQGLQRILYMIENKSPVLLIKELDIKQTQLHFKSVVKPKDKEEKVSVTVVVSGFYRAKPGEV